MIPRFRMSVSEQLSNFLTIRCVLSGVGELGTEKELPLRHSPGRCALSRQASYLDGDWCARRYFQWWRRVEWLSAITRIRRYRLHPSGVTEEGAPPRQWWLEKTLVKGRPDKEQGDLALGKALWSPKTSKDGGDIYRAMRDVRLGSRSASH